MRPTTDTDWGRIVANAILIILLVLDATPASFGAFALALVYSIVSLQDRDFGISIPIRLLELLTPLVLMVITGLAGSLTHNDYDAAKDLWYFTHPIVTIAFGYFWFRRSGRLGDAVDIYALGGVVTSCMFFYSIYTNWARVILTGSLDRYRYLVGTGNMLTITSIGLILLAQSHGVKDSIVLRRRWLKWLVCFLCLIAVGASFSRTLILCVLAAYLLSLSFDKLIKRGLLFLVVGGVIFVASPDVGGGNYNDSFFSQFIFKVKNSGAEVSVHPFQSTEEIENNWRGYEVSRALKTFDGFDALQKVIGGGFGQLVDLGFEQKVYDFDFVRIPVLHNGYAFILVKTGVLGEVFFVWFLIPCLILYWRGVGEPRECPESTFGMIILWAVAVIVLTEGGAGGLYAKGDYDSITCLVGFCFSATAEGALRSSRTILGDIFR